MSTPENRDHLLPYFTHHELEILAEILHQVETHMRRESSTMGSVCHFTFDVERKAYDRFRDLAYKVREARLWRTLLGWGDG